MASLPIGRSLEPFDPQTEDFEEYAERLEQYFLVNDVSDKKKQVAFFLTVVGSSTYQVLRDLLAPDTPASRTLEELLEVLKGHYKPARPEIIYTISGETCRCRALQFSSQTSTAWRERSEIHGRASKVGKNMFWAISKRRIKGPVGMRVNCH